MIPIVTPEEMGAIDAAAPEPVEELIDRAGRATAREAMSMLGGAYGRTVVVIAGAGNNGADGRTAGEYLARRGVKVRVVDAVTCPPILPPCDLVIDAAFGTGFRGEWIAPAVTGTSGGPPMVLAVDIPSGVNALTGDAGTGVLAADRTVTFQALKPGLVFGAGRRLAGDVVVADIGLDVTSADLYLVEAADVAGWWPRRATDAHKWKGAVRVVAGSVGMLGAGRLCAAAAARAGAGLVTLSSPGADPHARSEIIQRPVPGAGFAVHVLDDLNRFGSLVIGPGLGREEATVAGVRELIADAMVPIVIDGDGIFAAAWSADGAAPLLQSRALATVVTPHDGEYALLRGAAPGTDRVAAARDLADDLRCTVLLKGPTTVVAGPNGPSFVIDHGDERLATAGSGDVLAGMIGALLAAGVDPEPAAAAAAWLHAEAASTRARAGTARRRHRRADPGSAVVGAVVGAVGMVMEPQRWAWVDVDLDAIRHNVDVLRSAVAPSEVWVVVKANAYGHGAVAVARAALDAGAGGLCVALVPEGVELRRAGIHAPILVLSEQPPEAAVALVANDLTPTVYTEGFVDALATAALAAGRSDLPVHVKVDTGMQRVGAEPDAVVALVDRIGEHSPTLRLGGVFTHLAVADEPDDEFTALQLGRFDEILSTVGVTDDVAVHAANSAGALAHRAARRSFVRAGIAVYGISPGHGVDDLCHDLRPALSLRARVSFVKTVRAGSRISYGLRHTFERDTTVATVPIGYADGVPRRSVVDGRRGAHRRSPPPDRRSGDDGSADGRLRTGRPGRCR